MKCPKCRADVDDLAEHYRQAHGINCLCQDPSIPLKKKFWHFVVVDQFTDASYGTDYTIVQCQICGRTHLVRSVAIPTSSGIHVSSELFNSKD